MSDELQIGTKVVKTSGYGFPGEIRADFHTRAGHRRLVVEAIHPPYESMLHIFSPEQLRPGEWSNPVKQEANLYRSMLATIEHDSFRRTQVYIGFALVIGGTIGYFLGAL